MKETSAEAWDALKASLNRLCSNSDLTKECRLAAQIRSDTHATRKARIRRISRYFIKLRGSFVRWISFHNLYEFKQTLQRIEHGTFNQPHNTLSYSFSSLQNAIDTNLGNFWPFSKKIVVRFFRTTMASKWVRKCVSVGLVVYEWWLSQPI